MNVPNFRKIDLITYKPGRSLLSSKKKAIKLSANESAFGAGERVRNILKNRNKIITKFIKDKSELSIFSLEKGKNYNLELELSGIWIYKNNAGYYINIINIRE